MNSTSETPLLNGMNTVPISSNNINLSNGRPLLTNTTDPVQPRFKRVGIVGRIKNMFKALPHEERRFEKLKEAIYDNNIDEIKRLLATGVNVNKVIYGYTLLHIAAERNNSDVIELLLAAGANPDVQNVNGDTPLDIIFKTHSKLYNSFLDNLSVRLLINASSELDSSLLFKAISKDDTNFVIFLIEKGANVNVKDSTYGRTPLLDAILRKNTDIVRLLLDASANLNITDNFGNAPFYIAVHINNTDIVKLLLDAGADSNMKNEHGNIPLNYASNADIVKLLLDAGADPNMKNEKGNIPLNYAINTDIVKLLLDAGADPNMKNKAGETPLYLAIKLNLSNVVRLLLEGGANPNMVNIYGKTPLHILNNYYKYEDGKGEEQESYNTDIAKLLLDAGANTEAKDIQGKTLLDYLKDGHNPELRALLEKTKGGSRKSRKSKKNKKRKTRRS
jgi:cytohesin